MSELSSDQKKTLDDVLTWYRKDRQAMQFVTLGGYAGTGKTTLIGIIREELGKIDKEMRVGFASYTGKAARVLKTKLSEVKAIRKSDSVGTIHSLIYSPVVNARQEIVGWKKKDAIDCNLIIIDEASMVDEHIWHHLLSYKIPIIAVGDHGQLPPIHGSFNLMQKPDLMLTQIHRQARENPIIAVSIQARTKGYIDPGAYSPSVRKYTTADSDMFETVNEMLSNIDNDTLVLCGYNITRKKLNAQIRTSKGFEFPEPSKGDRVVCLRNNHKKHIYNGELGTIENITGKDDHWYRAEIIMDEEGDLYDGLISKDQFTSATSLNFTDKRSAIMGGDLFDFGYALTVHKAQGSQARRVILFEERFKQMTDDDWKRWLYTAVTRASEELYIFAST